MSCNCSEVPQLIIFPFSFQFVHHLTYHNYTATSLSIVPNAQLEMYNCHTHWTAYKLLLCHILLVLTETKGVSKFKNPDYQLATHSIFHSTTARPVSFSSLSLSTHSSLFDSPVTRLNTLPQTASKVTVLDIRLPSLPVQESYSPTTCTVPLHWQHHNLTQAVSTAAMPIDTATGQSVSSTPW